MSREEISKRIKRLRYVSKPLKYIAFGFVREFQREITESGSYYANKSNHYPILIGYLCLSYYQYPEFFARKSTHDSIYIATNRVRIIKCIGGDYTNHQNQNNNNIAPYSTATGIARIPSTHNVRIIWSVKIGENMKRNDRTIIGITSDPNHFQFNQQEISSPSSLDLSQENLVCYGLRQRDWKCSKI